MIFSQKRSTTAAILWMLLLYPATGAAQQRTDLLQVGPALWPGVGLQIGFVQPKTIYTLEAMLYTEGQLSGRNSLQLSAGVGVSFRPLAIPRIIGNADYGYDIDIGVRFGPSLTFRAQATRADKNTQFHLFFDPFVRFSSPFIAGQLTYIEVGIVEPRVRIGLFFRLRRQR